MKEEKPDPTSPGYLRCRAEELLNRKKIKDVQKMTEQDVRAMAYELQVHQIELEMQNEELKRARAEAEDSLRKYADLYDFSPVGYFTFDKKGTILEVNLAGTALLDIEKCNLIDKRFQLFVKPDGIHAFNTFCSKVFEMNSRQSCKVKLVRNDKSLIYVRIEGIVIENQKGKECRASVTDITAYKHEEEKIHLLQTLSLAISKAGDMHTMIEIILRRVCELAGWMYAEIWIPSPDHRYLEYGRWYSNLGHMEEFAMKSKGFVFPPGVGIPGQVWATKQPVWVEDVTLDPNYQRAKVVGNVGLKSAFAFPLTAGEEVVAVVVSYTLEALGKDGQLVNLITSISNHLGWVVKRKQLEEKIQHMAYNDALTSLPNRRQFYDCLALELSHARRNKTMLAVMLLDLDGFKFINDTLGHSVGDQVLKGMAGRLRSCMRASDTVSRLGGDEFTVVLSMIGGVEDAAMLANKIIEAVRQPLEIESNKLIVTTSIGIAFFPDNGEDVETLMKHADIAMYRAKRKGKNNYQFSVTRNLKSKKRAKL